MVYLVIIIFLISPIISTPLIILSLIIDNKNYKIYILGISFNLAFIGYYYDPIVSNDLYRHFLTMDVLKNKSFLEALFYDPLIMKNFWFYIISKINLYNLLPFTAILIPYYLVMKDMIEFGRNQIRNNLITVSLTLLIISWIGLIGAVSGIRFIFSIFMFFHGLYREYILKKNNLKTKFYYIIPLFIHYSIVVLFVLKFIVNVLDRIKNKSKFILLFLLSFWGVILEKNLSLIESSVLPYLNSDYFIEVNEKIIFYMDYFHTGSYYIANYYMKLFFAFILIILCFISFKKNNIGTYNKFYLFGILSSVFIIGGHNIFIIVTRYGSFLLLMMPFFMILFFKYNNIGYIKTFYFIFYIVFLLLGVYYSYIPFKKGDFDITLLDFLVNNILNLLFKLTYF